jgi:hypothetical protein
MGGFDFPEGLAQYAGISRSPAGISTSPASSPVEGVLMTVWATGWTAAANPRFSLLIRQL